MAKFNSLSTAIKTLLDNIDNQIFINKAGQWLSSLPAKSEVDIFKRYFEKGFALTELEDYAIFVVLAETVCRGHVNQYLYPYDEPLGIKRLPLDCLANEIKNCPANWITDFEGIINRIAKQHNVDLSPPNVGTVVPKGKAGCPKKRELIDKINLMIEHIELDQCAFRKIPNKIPYLASHCQWGGKDPADNLSKYIQRNKKTLPTKFLNYVGTS